MSSRILVYGYGNPARLDDGLGPALVHELARRGLDGVALETNYQLQIEDAALLAEFDAVIFVDADRMCPEPFELRAIAPRASDTFTTHAIAPEALFALARHHFGGPAAAYVLGIRGYAFYDFGEVLSAPARRNLAAATDALERALREERFTAETVCSERERS